MAQYGTVGLNVGLVGRWLRLVYGGLIVIPIIVELALNFNATTSLAFYGRAALYFIGIAAGYTLVYYLLGERFLARVNAWVNTLIFVGPAIVVAWWNTAIAPATGISLPGAFTLAMGFYIGISFLLQWRIKYGGCEVVSLPILLFKRRYVTYCVPLVAVDATEKKFMDSTERARKLVWAGIMATLFVAFLTMVVMAVIRDAMA